MYQYSKVMTYFLNKETGTKGDLMNNREVTGNTCFQSLCLSPWAFTNNFKYAFV